jgi:hypothetical protein
LATIAFVVLHEQKPILIEKEITLSYGSLSGIGQLLQAVFAWIV